IDARAVYVQREALRSDASSPALDSLLCYVEASFAYVAETITTYPAGTISWHLLWTQLEIGEDLETVHDVTGETNLQEILALPARPLTKEKKASLRERGQTYTQYAGQVHASYEGFFFTGAFSGADRLMGEGQVVIDVKSFRRCNPTLDHWGDDVVDRGGTTQWATHSSSRTKPCPHLLHLLLPSIHGFSLRAKRFGKFLISRLSPVIWRDESFSHLVIPASYRQIVKALVTVHAGELKEKLMVNAVEGKGNGLVMAFHGAPGTGKTLTAEAVAEHLRRPLYVVSAGELGMTAQTLDNQLKNVLELATAWNAVILIDEADIFLTKRDTRQLERNALVGIFLRLLKYSGGVLILTTNHIKNFGKAFLSRFAIVLRFDELDEPSCRTLWEQFLLKATSSSSSSLSAFDLAHLASFRLNGRDIKHVIQTAQAVALVKGDELGMEHLDDVLRVAKSGMRRE
ncbi:P-loop containing nucleoside triphosphate hydrolase protein, partial [Rhodotorula toruloides]